MYLSTENLCNSKHTHYSTYCISPKTSLTTREQLHVKVSLRYITEHLSQVLWTLRTSWERLRSWRGCGMPSWSSCTLCAPWRSPSTSSQSWWRMAACWSTSRVRQPTSTRDYELLYDWVRVRCCCCCCSMKTISPPEAKARDVSQSNYIIVFPPVSTLCPHFAPSHFTKWVLFSWSWWASEGNPVAYKSIPLCAESIFGSGSSHFTIDFVLSLDFFFF